MKIKRLLVLGVFLLFLLEATLRVFGIHKLPVYESSSSFEYRTTPNQSGKILGKEWSTNALGMRGEIPKETDKRIVWFSGDSVINGGVHTSDDSLATSIWDHEQEQKLGVPIATVNISQGSWGPENGFCFAQEFPQDLGSPELVVLALSSHDWNDNMTFCYSGHTRDMPSYVICAIHAMVNKYLGREDLCPLEHQVDSKNAGLEKWMSWASENKVQLMAYLHPTVEELQKNERDSVGALLENWLNSQRISTLDGVSFLQESDFRDHIHLSESGQASLARALSSFVTLKN